MRHFMHSLWALPLWLVCSLAPPLAEAAGPVQAAKPAHATKLSAADAKAVRAVIEAQLAAFAADDAKRAFALAAPGVREVFGDADNFLAMVRTGYPVVYRPASVAFLQPELVDGDVLQRVQLTDESGHAWMALYQVQRQPDKSWRIGGCEVVESEGRFTRAAPGIRTGIAVGSGLSALMPV